MSIFSFGSIKTALSNALEYLPDWSDLTKFQKGHVIDKTFKSLLRDLMEQFGMKAGKDYVDNLKENEQSTDFVCLSAQADELLRGLMEGRIVAVKGHSKVSKLGNNFSVKPYFKKNSRVA